VTEITVRKATDADFLDIQRLNAELFKFEDSLNVVGHTHTRNLNWPYSDYAVKYFHDAASGQNNCQAFVAVVNVKVVGYLITSLYSKNWMAQNPIAEIDNMFVSSDFRHHGAGSKLVAAYKDWAMAKGAKRLKVGALTENHPAMDFYKSQGFINIETFFEQPGD
jgi:ribosomal protein S18 acetylase RimI-like enzyme